MLGFYYLFTTIKAVKECIDIYNEVKKENEEIEHYTGDVVDLKDYK